MSLRLGQFFYAKRAAFFLKCFLSFLMLVSVCADVFAQTVVANNLVPDVSIPKVLTHSPLVNKASMVVEGKARFTVLTSSMIRIEWSDTHQFEDRSSLTFINRDLPTPTYSTVNQGGWLELQTSAIKLRYKLNATALNAETLSVVFKNGENLTQWWPGLKDTKNLLGTTRTVDGFEGVTRHRDGAHIKLEPGLVSQSGWRLIDDSQIPLFNGRPSENRLGKRVSGNTDWYLLAHGTDYKAALFDFTQVAGKIPMPPKFAFGYWWSRYWAYSDSELRALVDNMQAYDIPLDVLVIDMDWHKTHGLTSKTPQTTPFGGMLGWTGYTWNTSLFPAPDLFLDWTAQNKLQVALNLHPADGIAPTEKSYTQMRRALGPVALTKDDWIEYRLSDPDWASAYFDTVLRPHEKSGVDFWWLDWQQWPVSKFVDGLSNTFWLNHVFFSDMETHYPDKRPLLFHRWGGLGNHRYQVGFSGDAVISWKSLAYQPYFTATASNVGYGYWSHDIGGHIDVYDDLAADGELYLRWIQFGALSPIFRTHSSKSDVVERRIWKYPDYFEPMRQAIRRRYTLFPFLYQLARQGHDSGVSMTRPMYYEYPNEDAAYQSTQQFMLGPDVIVAPVAKPVNPDTQLASQKIWLPEGTWYEWDTGHLISGNKRITRNVALEEIPIYLRAGAIITMQPDLVSNLQSLPDSIVLAIAPGDDGKTIYYEDDGVSQGYMAGQFAKTTISTRRSDKTLIVDIGKALGSYSGLPSSRYWVLRIEGVSPVQSVDINGQHLGSDAITYNAQTLSASIALPSQPTSQAHRVEVKFAQPLEKMTNRLSGKAGQFKRLKMLGAKVKTLAARDDWAATVPDALLRIIETPQRIQYRPQHFEKEITRFDAELPLTKGIIANMPQITPAETKNLMRLLAFGE